MNADLESIHCWNPERGIHPLETHDPPSERQIAYAEYFGRQASIAVPTKAYQNRGACGRFIGEARSKYRNVAKRSTAAVHGD